MTVKVRVPAALRSMTGDVSVVEAHGRTVSDVIKDLERQYPGMKARLCTDDGCLGRLMNIYVQGDDIKFLSGLETELREGTEVMIIPAAAGG